MCRYYEYAMPNTLRWIGTCPCNWYGYVFSRFERNDTATLTIIPNVRKIQYIYDDNSIEENDKIL